MPFTVQQFFDVFRRYNETVWPAQWGLALLAVVAIVAALRTHASGARTTSAVLVILWLWNGAVYHIAFFSAINPAALLFGTLFIAESALFYWYGVRRRQLDFRARADGTGIIGGLMLLYALVIYPMLSTAFGHRYPETPTFGVPCPTTIFTFGLLLWCRPPVPRRLVVIPTGWALLGVTAAFQFGVWEDVGLLVAAAIAAPILLLRRPRVHRATAFAS